ncbi:hypothetical protein [Halocynthiibacter namhaensis]|uniref:hypothetical protein n=1 Tax=Halocynthiibacter namhaensis TaxID=1290553 RepID=UPI0012E079A3|nr:hypothetical protein [Halocynthiibacter namhaensis]
MVQDKVEFQRGEMDALTGSQWVYVPRHVAHGHRLGRIGVIFYLIILYFLAEVVFHIVGLGQGLGGDWYYDVYRLGTHALMIVLSLLTIVGILMRAPATILFVVAHFCFSILLALTGPIFGVVVGAGSFLVLFYMMDSDRANLIFRHRYRSWVNETDAAGAAQTTRNAGEADV